MKIATLVGSGHKIGLFVLPFLLVGLYLNLTYPSVFSVGGPPLSLEAISAVILLIGLVVWAWSAFLLLTKVPKKQLITTGPYAVVKHPLYTNMAFLVLPWLGFLLNTWLGIVLGIVLYAGSRLFSPEEERMLSKTFGKEWDDYCKKVLVKWL